MLLSILIIAIILTGILQAEKSDDRYTDNNVYHHYYNDSKPSQKIDTLTKTEFFQHMLKKNIICL